MSFRLEQFRTVRCTMTDSLTHESSSQYPVWTSLSNHIIKLCLSHSKSLFDNPMSRIWHLILINRVLHCRKDMTSAHSTKNNHCIQIHFCFMQIFFIIFISKCHTVLQLYFRTVSSSSNLIIKQSFKSVPASQWKAKFIWAVSQLASFHIYRFIVFTSIIVDCPSIVEPFEFFWNFWILGDSSTRNWRVQSQQLKLKTQ